PSTIGRSKTFPSTWSCAFSDILFTGLIYYEKI
ncbi:MAG: hypothetical protein ACI81T_004419, partial [Bacteroidia bacterium]